MLNRKVLDIRVERAEGRFDAAFLVVGAHIGERAFIPAGSAARMLDAGSVLRGMDGEDKPLLGRRENRVRLDFPHLLLNASLISPLAIALCPGRARR